MSVCKTIFCLGLLGLLLVGFSHQSNAAEQSKPSMIILHPFIELGYGEVDVPIIDPKLKKMFNDAGFQIDGAYFKDIDLDRLKHYNVAVIAEVPAITVEGDVADIFVDKLDVLEEYVQSGGGLLIFHAESYYAMFNVANKAYKDIGLEIIPELIKTDDESRLEKKYNADFLVVKEFVEHPVTDNINKLLFPTRINGSIDWGIWPFKADDKWDIILTAGKDAYSTEIDGSPGSFSSAPPISALRSYGKGRIGIIASTGCAWIEAPWHHFWHTGYLYDKSDDFQFFVNMLNWLGEPSLKAGSPGGYVQVDKPKKVLGEFEGGYRRRIATKPDETPFPGIIGIKTKYSGYRYTVADFAEAAKDAGLSYIVVAEDRDKMNKDKWGDLVADCAASSNFELLVIPGIDFITKDGWRTVYFSDKYKHMWVPDDRVRAGVEHYHTAKGWQGKDCYAGFFNILWDSGAVILTEPHRLAGYNQYWVKFYSAFDIYHYDKDLNLTDESLDWYKDMTGHYYLVMPTAVTEITAPDQLRSFSGYKTYALTKSVDNIPDAFNRSKTSQTFVSAGPVITEFWLGGYGASEDVFEFYHSWYAGDTIEINIGIESKEPVTKVTVFKNNKVFRRYYPNSTSFHIQDVDIARETGFFTMVAEDSNGNRAVSAPLPTRHFERWTRMCTDNQNTIDNMIVPNESGNLIFRGKRSAAYTISTFCQRWWFGAMYTPRDASNAAPVGVESSIQGNLFFYSRPVVKTKNGEIHPQNPERKIQFGSGDCAVLRNHFTGDVVESVNTFYSFTPRQDSINMMLIDYDITFKKDIELADTADIASIIDDPDIAFKGDENYLGAAGNAVFPQGNYLIREDSGEKINLWDITLLFANYRWDVNMPGYLSFDGNNYETGPLFENGKSNFAAKHIGPDGFIAIGPDYWASVGAFGMGKADLVAVVDPHYLKLGMKLPDKHIKAGTKMNFQILLTENGRWNQDDLDFAKEIYDTYGLDGTPAYKVNLENGKIVTDNYILKMTAKNYFVKGTISRADIANDLPIRVDGVEDNWASGIYDYETKKLHLTGSHDGTVFTKYDINPEEGVLSDRPVFIGNIIQSNNPDVKIDVVTLNADGTCKLHLHNPLSEVVNITVEPVLDVISANPVTVTLQPGQSNVAVLK